MASADREHQPYGLPTGTVRGFLSILFCSFFWVILLFPGSGPGQAPLGHFFLLALVFLAFASHPVQEIRGSAVLPWVMRLIFVGGSIAVVVYVGLTDSARLADRLTPKEDMGQVPALLGCLVGGFGAALLLRSLFGRTSEMFMTIRGWTGVLATLLLLAETVFQFMIWPTLSDKPSEMAMKVWEGILIAVVAAYFGSRA